jgi:hypothetical protein
MATVLDVAALARGQPVRVSSQGWPPRTENELDPFEPAQGVSRIAGGFQPDDLDRAVSCRRRTRAPSIPRIGRRADHRLFDTWFRCPEALFVNP